MLASCTSSVNAAGLHTASTALALASTTRNDTDKRVRSDNPSAISVGNFGVRVVGQNIVFPNTDYYQVQRTSTLANVFEGNANPRRPLRVIAGAYNIINLTTGARIDSVVIRVASGATAPQTPIQSFNKLSCFLTNSTFVINYGKPVQYGKSPINIRIKWTNSNGSHAAVPQGGEVKAVDASGALVGQVTYISDVGNSDHPVSVYGWKVNAGSSYKPVRFIYRATSNEQPCFYIGVSRTQSSGTVQVVPPATTLLQPTADIAPEPTYGSQLSEIELQQRSEGVLAFPGALGFGRKAIGGRSGRILTVNTVKNIVNPSDNLLSLREAIEVEKGPRTVVFSVGGVFDTGTGVLNILRKGKYSGSYLTVACQSAPSPGVVIKTYGFNVQHGAHDLVFRHCAVRGIDSGYGATAGRGMTVRGGSKNIILDHMSFSWATDEGFQVYVDKNQTQGTDNITLSNSIIAEGDADSSHPLSKQRVAWGYHAMGPSCNNNNSRVRPQNCSIVNNYIAHNSSRNGMIWGGTGEISNNVVYNWYGIGVTAQPQDGSGVDVIVNNNLMKSGPTTQGGTSNPNCGKKDYRCALFLKPTTGSMIARYAIGNNYYVAKNRSLADAQLMSTHVNANSPNGRPWFQPATPSPEPVLSMAARGSRFMKCVGASKPSRDKVDARVIEEFYRGTGAVGIGENFRIGGAHNVTRQRTFWQYGAPTTHPADYDKDKDGMADVWEVNYGLDDTNPNDHSGDEDRDGYTNIEEYLAIAAFCQ